MRWLGITRLSHSTWFSVWFRCGFGDEKTLVWRRGLRLQFPPYASLRMGHPFSLHSTDFPLRSGRDDGRNVTEGRTRRGTNETGHEVEGETVMRNQE
jgi:hypothetical protein